MMQQIWKGSYLGRFCLALREMARKSALCAFFRFLARTFEASTLRRLGLSFLSSPARWSATARLPALVHRGLDRFYTNTARHFETAKKRGLFAPIWHRARKRAQTSRMRSKSIVLAPFRRASIRHYFLLFFALYFPIDYMFRQFPGLSFFASYWDEIFLGLAFCYLFFSQMMRPRPTQSLSLPLDAPLYFFLGVCLFLMCVISPIFGVAFSGFRAVCQFMLWFFIVARLLRSRKDILFFCTALVLVGTFLALHGIYQYIIAVPIPSNWVSMAESGVRTRVFSLIGSPNILGDLMVMLAPVTIALSYVFKTMWKKLFFFVAGVCMCLTCVFTFTRGAWFGLVLAAVVFALLRDRRILLLLLAGLAVALMIPQIFNRIAFLTTADFAAANEKAGRSARWGYGLDLLYKNNPWLGYGLGRFGGAVAMQNQTMEKITYFYLDNYYMKTFVETGFVGLGSYIFLLCTLVLNGLRSLFRARQMPDDYTLACGIFSGMVGVLAHCFFENIFEVPYMSAYFWGLAAVLLVIGFRLHRSGAGKSVA